MKTFRANERCYTFSAFIVDRVPVCFEPISNLSQIQPEEALAKTVIEDACYLSSDGSGQIAIEMLRITDAYPGKPVVHLLIIRCQDPSQRSCQIRHEACVQGMHMALHQNGYQIREITFEDYLSYSRTTDVPASWSIRKASLQEKGSHGTYISIFCERLPWKRIWHFLTVRFLFS